MADVSVILNNAPTASVLAANAARKGTLFGGNIDPNLSITIYANYKVLKTIYDKNPNYDGLYAVAQRLWEMMGRFGIQAAAYTGTGGGSGGITPITPVTGVPAPYYFSVDGTSFIPTGGSAKSIPTFIDYNLVFVRNGITQTEVQTEPSYFTWDSTTGIFTCSPALQQFEIIGLIPT